MIDNKIFGKGIIPLLLVIILSINVNALGVAPSREIIDFEPGKQTLQARIINNDRVDMRLAVYPQGELAQYVTLQENQVTVNSDEGERTINYEIDLPANLSPGTRELQIVIIQLPETFGEGDQYLIVAGDGTLLFDSREQESMISATTAVIHQLQVRVPYPDSHIEGRLYVSEGKVGETLTVTVPVVNRGTKTTDVYAEIIMKGPTNEELAVIKTDTAALEAGKETNLFGEWKADVNQGLYLAEVKVHYKDKFFTLRKVFHVGNIFVSIEDLSVKSFKLGGIAKFDVGIKNKWNQEITDIYGELNILEEDGGALNTVKTLSTDLDAQEDGELNGYWDTTGVNVGRYDVNVILHYAGKTTEKLFQTVVSIDKITIGQIGAGKVTGGETGGNTTALLIILVSVLIAANIGWFVFFRKKLKK